MRAKNDKPMYNGKIFGEWEVIDSSKENNRRGYWLCKCSCGVVRSVFFGDLKRGTSANCGHNKKVDLTGKIFGEWKVLYSSRITEDKFVHYWMCQCSCGIIKEVWHGNLVDGISTSCGHINKVYPDIHIGMKFNEWEVIGECKRKNKSTYWLCKCSCGIEKYVDYRTLFQNTSTNCGHLHSDGIKKDMKYGRLTVINFDHRDKKGISWYLCKCDCGNIKTCRGSELKNGGVKSCGCYRSEFSSESSSKRLLKNPYLDYKRYNWYFFDKSGNKIFCKSSYEVFFWNYYYFEKNIELLYEPKTFILNKSSRYTPDFYFPLENRWIETKGSFGINIGSRKQKDKIDEISKEIDIKVFFWKDIVINCNLKHKCLSTYFNKAKKENIKIEDYLANMLYNGERNYAYISKTI